MEPVVGIEPTTVRLQIGCSTAELNWPVWAHYRRFESKKSIPNRKLSTICGNRANRTLFDNHFVEVVDDHFNGIAGDFK